MERTSVPITHEHDHAHNNARPATTPTITHRQHGRYCTQPIPGNSRGGMDVTGVDVMSMLPPATEAGAANNNDGDCEIVNDGAGDGGVGESKDDEPVSVTSALPQAQADFQVPEGFRRLHANKHNSSNMYKLGVRVESTEQLGEHAVREGRWYCL